MCSVGFFLSLQLLTQLHMLTVLPPPSTALKSIFSFTRSMQERNSPTLVGKLRHIADLSCVFS